MLFEMSFTLGVEGQTLLFFAPFDKQELEARNAFSLNLGHFRSLLHYYDLLYRARFHYKARIIERYDPAKTAF